MDFEKEIQELKEKITPASTVKYVAGTIISLGAAAAIASLFSGHIKNAKGITKLMMKIGIFVLGCKAGDVAETYFVNYVDDTIKTFKEAQEEMKV